ncbi:hypothetical protein E2C01_036620 [Portunus trituberculatus]|uniref:Uncharacterized protein n=1 Tax=Portunus trituberculatus TaxID=210409 RepID=A0A5B7FBV9_PORTR|nr:hypothetical protein [Portunus trituberculatus]
MSSSVPLPSLPSSHLRASSQPNEKGQYSLQRLCYVSEMEGKSNLRRRIETEESEIKPRISSLGMERFS